jgi:UDP-N-acetylmuramoylalanine--D-glutamate ligase
VLFVDDTLATIPEATIGAIAAFPGRQLTLIVGGYDRGISYDSLRDYLAQNCAGATIIGLPDSGPRILDALRGIPDLTLVAAQDMGDAVRVARERTGSGGVVLMSPAAPSYGHFDNFEHRSRVFRRLVAASRPGDLTAEPHQ